MRQLRLFFNEFRLFLWMSRRYWFESAAAFALMMIIFGGVIFSLMSVGDVSLQSGKLDHLIVGFALWMFASSTFSSAANEVGEEIRQRTLEQLCLCPTPLFRILGMRSAIRLLGAIVTLSITLLFANIVSEGRIGGNYLEILALLLLAAPSVMGLGYLVAGVVLIFRKGEAIQLLVYPCLIALIAIPAYPLNFSVILPYAFGASAVKAMNENEIIGVFDFSIVLLNSTIWIILGSSVFLRLERRARRLGVMGHI